MQVFHLIAILQLIAAGNSILSPKVYYSTGPDAQCQAQQALDCIDRSVLKSLSNLVQPPPPCGIGPWTRVAYLNMSDPLEKCPTSWRLYSANGVRACGRTTGGCHSQNYPVQQTHCQTNESLPYRKVCGRIIGYQIGSTNVFGNRQLSIDEPYVDGVSVTYGDPRRHIWTFAAGISETVVNRMSAQNLSCPCALVGTGIQLQEPPVFVGDNYFCESGNPENTRENTNIFRYTDDPLWDGESCEGQCCNNTNYSSPPWFNVMLPNITSEDIEVRICANQGTSNEDVAIELLEIYVQ